MQKRLWALLLVGCSCAHSGAGGPPAEPKADKVEEKAAAATPAPSAPPAGATNAPPTTPPAPPPGVAGAAHHDHASHAGPPPPSLTLPALAAGAKLLPGLGTHHRAVTTQVPEAQQYFDQGLRLTYGFNHDEASRSYAKAAELDPKCAACFWGAALVLGPNYNVPMLPDRAKAAWEALTRARAAAAGASPVEQALIEALGKRYGGPEPLDPPAMQPFQEAYAAAMREVAQKFPDDLDVQVLAAEALMNVNPWKLWSLDGKPAPGTEEIVANLEKALARAPNHPGANHYYIHAIEASPQPGKALRAADRLGKLLPGAGHLVHMPAHIYQRVGKYAEASKQNQRAAEVDLQYMPSAPAFAYYAVYLNHNYGFLSFSSSMEGRRAVSLQAAENAVKNLPKEIVCAMPGMDFLVALPYFAQVRFGQWDALLAQPRPEAKYPILTGLWLHGRGMALASTGKLEEARASLDELKKLAARLPPDLLAGLGPATDLLGVGAMVLGARIAEKAGEPEALARWRAAVAAADLLPYSEPADWFYPVRHFLGAALLAAKQPAEAEAVYREDLRRNPKNGWALFGLGQSLRAQKKSGEAAKVDKEFKAAWKNADIKLSSSAF